jgi:hypothetical protein
MKKISIVLTIALLSFSTSVLSQSTLENTIKGIIDTIKSENYQIANIAAETITVNSTYNATCLGGKSREAIKFTLPEGTKKYALRVTVIPISSDFQYKDNESLYSLIQKGISYEVTVPQDDGIDFFFLDQSNDVDEFLADNNFYASWFVNKTNSFTEIRGGNPGNYWIGIRNPNIFDGLKTIVEVVSLGTYLKNK